MATRNATIVRPSHGAAAGTVDPASVAMPRQVVPLVATIVATLAVMLGTVGWHAVNAAQEASGSVPLAFLASVPSLIGG